MSLNKIIVMSLRGDAVDEAISEIIMEFATLRSQRHSKETLLEILKYVCSSICLLIDNRRSSREEVTLMKDYSAATYGEQIAEDYDQMYPSLDQAIIPKLVELSQGGRALELGIGTGRIALPLQQAGIEVHGIEASQAMQM